MSDAPHNKPSRRCCKNCVHCYWMQPDCDIPYVYRYCDMGRGGLGDKEKMTSKDCPHYAPNDGDKV